MLTIKRFFINGLLLIAATTMASEPEDRANSVKSTVERALGSNNTDNADNIHFLNKVQRVISNIKNVFVNNRNARRAMNTRHEEFTDFIQNVIKKLNKYDDTDLENFFAVFGNEVTSYHYKGCKFHELTENFAFRIYLSGLLKDIKMQPGAVIKTKLEAIANKIKKKQYDRNEKELVDVINSLYRQDSIEKFQNVLMNIDAYRMKSRKNVDLVQIVRDGLRSVVFDHYTKLKHNARRALKLQINEYWNSLSGQLPSKAKDYIKTSKFDKNEFTTKPQDSGANKRIILKETDRFIEIGLKYGQDTRLRNDERKVTLKSLYLPSVLTTPKLSKTDTIKFRKDLKPEANAETYIQKINRRLNNVNQTTHTPSRTPKHSRTARYYTKNNMNLKYETDPYEYLTAEVRKKKLTFMTLYPEFVSAWTSSERLQRRQKLSHRRPVDKIKYMWQEADISDITPKPERIKAVRLVKKLGATFDIGMANSPTLKNIRKKIKHGAATNKFQAQQKLQETSSEKIIRLKKKVRLSKSAKPATRRRSFFTDKPYKHQQHFGRPSIVSLESGSSDDLAEAEQKVSYRRNEITNTTATNSSLTVLNETFKVQHPEIIGSQMKNENGTVKALNDDAKIERVKDQLSSENNKTSMNITVLNTKFNVKRNNTEVDSMKVRLKESTGEKYPDDFNGNKSIPKISNQTIHSSDEPHSRNEELHDFNANRETNELKSKHYLQDNKTYSYSGSSYNNTDKYIQNKSYTNIYNKENSFKPHLPSKDNTNFEGVNSHLNSDQVKSEQSLGSNEELEAWEPEAKRVSKKSSVEYANYYARRKHNARKRFEDTHKSSPENINNNIENIVTTKIPIRTAAIVNSKPTTKIDPAYYDTGADVIANIDDILVTRDEVTATSITNNNGKSVTPSKTKNETINSGEIKDISEDKDHQNNRYIGQDMYENTNERIKYIKENDLLADDFPELVPVLGKIAGRA